MKISGWRRYVGSWGRAEWGREGCAAAAATTAAAAASTSASTSAKIEKIQLQSTPCLPAPPPQLVLAQVHRHRHALSHTLSRTHSNIHVHKPPLKKFRAAKSKAKEGEVKSIERNGEIKTLFPRKLQKPTYLLPLSADSPLQLTKKLSTHTYTHTHRVRSWEGGGGLAYPPSESTTIFASNKSSNQSRAASERVHDGEGVRGKAPSVGETPNTHTYRTHTLVQTRTIANESPSILSRHSRVRKRWALEAATA